MKDFLILAQENEILWKAVFLWNQSPEFPSSHFPLSHHKRSVAVASAQLKIKGRVQSFYSMLGQYPVQHQASLLFVPIATCQFTACGVHVAIGHTGDYKEAGAKSKEPESRERAPVWGIMCLQIVTAL